MIHRKTIDNLIAQTNYLSSMLQTYHDVLLKQSHSSHEQSKSSESQQDSIFESEESQNKSQGQNFLSNERQVNLISPYLNESPYQSDIFDHEIHDRPTGYMREEDKKELKERIFMVESSIQFCFKAIQSQLQIRKKLNQKEMLNSSMKGTSQISSFEIKGQKTIFKKSLKRKNQYEKLKSK